MIDGGYTYKIWGLMVNLWNEHRSKDAVQHRSQIQGKVVLVPLVINQLLGELHVEKIALVFIDLRFNNELKELGDFKAEFVVVYRE